MGEYTNEVTAWMEKAKKSLEIAKKLLEDLYSPESIVRSYYAMFYAARALLVNDGLIKVTKHSGVISILGREYVKAGKMDAKFHKMIRDAFKLRQKSDYELFWEADREKAAKLLEDANTFVAKIEELLELKQ